MEHVEEWIEEGFLQRCSHALLLEGRTWLIDPVDDARVDELKDVAGVIQLLDRHKRDCVTIANRLGVAHHVVPEEPIRPFEFIRIRMSRTWKEVALWWPERRVLVCADALGTVGYYRARRERLGVHPFLRLRPPRFDVRPDVILCGHGAGIFDDAPGALTEALTTSRRRMPAQVVNAAREWRRSGST